MSSPMLSPTLSITAPEGASQPATSARRRGLSYLRNLSQNRSSTGNSSDSSRNTPRSYFQRSISYTEPRSQTSRSRNRRRSNSRPNEPTSPLAEAPQLVRTASADNPNSRIIAANPEARTTELQAGQSNTGVSRQNTENSPDNMVRHRSSNARRAASSTLQNEDVNEGTSRNTNNRPDITRTVSSTNGENQDPESKAQLPTIRFFPHQETRNGRQSLVFPPVSRTLPSEHSVLRVGRYSEREGVPTSNPSSPSDAPVGFKSKVVSRKHCEFSFVDGQWHIKDVASSSGTFLNHIRLSQPNTESRLFPIKDGDIVQLGIDFRGGEEMIFRCVKIRIECNRAWQKKPNNFNKSRHAQLQNLAKDQVTPGANSGECSICLGSILPCQSLFVAPCAHVWHYKCIRPLLEGKNSTYPQFQCPNCRAYTDLTAEVDIAESDMDEWMETTANGPNEDSVTRAADVATPPVETEVVDTTMILNDTSTPQLVTDESTEESTVSRNINGSDLLARRRANNPNSTETQSINGIDLPARPEPNEITNQLEQQRTRTETPDPEQIIGGEGPLTPRNNAGPFVFDGSAGRGSQRQSAVPGIPEVAEEVS